MIASCEKFGVILCLALCLSASETLFAQQDANKKEALNDRRQLDRPLFLPDSDIPSATVRRLSFEPGDSGNQITFYSTGDDKMIRKWSVSLESGNYSLVPHGKIRWPLLKNDHAGLINAISRRDYDQDLRLLAFGGFV